MSSTMGTVTSVSSDHDRATGAHNFSHDVFEAHFDIEFFEPCERNVVTESALVPIEQSNEL